jgi:transposase InsO family protein
MDMAKYCVNAVLVEGRSVRAVAAATGSSKSWVQRHVVLYRAGGDEALVPLKRGPRAPANLTSAAWEDEIVLWRKRLAEDGLDAGARTIHWHLSQSARSVPALSTIHRILRRRGFVTPQPQKRPRSSWIRFESTLPNETWQSDMTHWLLADLQPVEIINFVDDYSRAVLASVAVPVAKSSDVVRIFFDAAAQYGLPQSVLSDNGAIYTTAYRGSHSGMEIELATLGITFKHGKPYHPQTQGKVERYHQTLKKWLRNKPLCADLAELQAQIDRFVLYYNETRPHTARGCPPMRAWRAMDKATIEIDGQKLLAHTKVRRDRVDKTGAFTLRYRSRLHHVGVGREHRGKRILILVADLDVRVIDEHGMTLRHLELDPSVDYQGRSRDIVF